jgi:pyrroloquinoline quinone biosynthesis protein E
VRPDPPLALLAELTHRCPLRCGYCSNPLALLRRESELPTDTWRRVLDEASALGVLQVHFSGGEPTVRADLLDLVAHARRADLYTNLITSGVLLDERKLRALGDAGLDHVQLSLQAAEALLADAIAGYAGHETKLRVARAVRDAGLPLTINAVVHRRNLHQLEACIALAVELGAERLEVAHVQYHGWAGRNVLALLPTEAQLETATRTVEAARVRLAGALRIDYVLPDYHASYPKRCMDGWGRRFLGITPSGNALPCHAAETLPGLRIENVRDVSLAYLWYDSPSFEAFRGTAWMQEPCRTCERRDIDLGGCRCQALALAGDARATDPVCERSPHRARVTSWVRRAADAADAPYTLRGTP